MVGVIQNYRYDLNMPHQVHHTRSVAVCQRLKESACSTDVVHDENMKIV